MRESVPAEGHTHTHTHTHTPLEPVFLHLNSVQLAERDRRRKIRRSLVIVLRLKITFLSDGHRECVRPLHVILISDIWRSLAVITLKAHRRESALFKDGQYLALHPLNIKISQMIQRNAELHGVKSTILKPAEINTSNKTFLISQLFLLDNNITDLTNMPKSYYTPKPKERTLVF